MKKLIPEECIRLETRVKATQDMNERDRLRTILGYDKGYSAEVPFTAT